MIIDAVDISKIIGDIKNFTIPLYPQENFNRVEQYRILSKIFEPISEKTCRPDLDAYLQRIRPLGSGVFGTVYEEKVIVKPYVGWSVILKQSRYEGVGRLVNEIYTAIMCNIIVINNIVPNLPLTYKYGVCVNNPDKESGGPQSYHYYIQEKFDKILRQTSDFSTPFIYSAVTQGVMTIAALQLYLNIAHGDLYQDNIMIQKGPPITYEYVLNNKRYRTQNEGSTLFFIDFGTAQYLDEKTGYRTKEKLTYDNLTNFTIQALYTDTPLYNIDLVVFLTTMMDMAKDNSVKVWLEGWIRELVRSPIRNHEEFTRSVEKYLYPKISTLVYPKSKEPTKVLSYRLDKESGVKINSLVLNSLPGIVKSIYHESTSPKDLGAITIARAVGNTDDSSKYREVIKVLKSDENVKTFIKSVIPWWTEESFLPNPDIALIKRAVKNIRV